MINVVVITLKGDIKYQFGIDKKVSEVIEDIENCKSGFYQVVDTCSIKVSEIISVETFKYDPKKEEKSND